VDRPSRVVAAHAAGPRAGELAEAAVRRVHARTCGRPLAWVGDGWQPYRRTIERVYRRPVRTGKRGRPPLRVPAGVRLTQAVKRRDRRGRLLGVEVRAALGAPVAQPHPVPVERRNGVLRDRLNCLTRETHAFAQTATTWDAAVGLALFEQNRLRPHPALREPANDPNRRRRYRPRTPAIALDLTDHPWTWPEFLTMHVPTTP
jgi:hypothetical protein